MILFGVHVLPKGFKTIDKTRLPPRLENEQRHVALFVGGHGIPEHLVISSLDILRRAGALLDVPLDLLVEQLVDVGVVVIVVLHSVESKHVVPNCPAEGPSVDVFGGGEPLVRQVVNYLEFFVQKRRKSLVKPHHQAVAVRPPVVVLPPMKLFGLDVEVAIPLDLLPGVLRVSAPVGEVVETGDILHGRGLLDAGLAVRGDALLAFPFSFSIGGVEHLVQLLAILLRLRERLYRQLVVSRLAARPAGGLEIDLGEDAHAER
mmetsp:Transcript_25901/g.46000  ORF Transcript_25901/g.46000 Transcript_25901/m.46000 type:complete len:261 (+) Transcript_25901:208-990(+)